MDNLELISSLKFYFEMKILCLENALAIRCQLSVDEQKKLRLYYSQYFSGLTAAVDLLKERYGEAFFSKLKKAMSFENPTDGKHNYDYVRVLRNRIVHRAYDINNGFHVREDGFPLLIAPEHVKERDGRKIYAFDYYLINLISKCEFTIPKVILKHLKDEGLLIMASISQADMERQDRQFINDSNVIPDWAKQAFQNISIDYTVPQEILINDLNIYNIVGK